MAALPFLAVAATAGGSLLSGITSAQSAGYQASVARQNAQIEQQNAQRAAQATSQQTETAGLKARQQDAGVKAAAAANGVDVGSGSAVDVQKSQHELGSLDVSNTAERGALQTYGYETQATSDQAQANLDQSQVVPDLLGGALKAGGSVLSGAPNLPSTFSWMGDSGAAANSYAASAGGIAEPTDMFGPAGVTPGNGNWDEIPGG